MISTYPADFFIYKIFSDISFEDLKTTCKNNNATTWDLHASQLNHMTDSWTNTPYFMTTIRQRGAVPKEFTNNEKDCTIVSRDDFRNINIQSPWDKNPCSQGSANGICIKIMDLGVAQ